MYTQCPHCQTLFRISTDQLKAAAGKAHCCRCDRVFSALDHLREPDSEENWPESRFIDDLPEQQNLELPFDEPATEAPEQELDSGLTDLLNALQIESDQAPAQDPEPEEQRAIDDNRDPFEPVYDLNDDEMDSVQIGLDSAFCGPLLPTGDGTEKSEQQNAEAATVDADTTPDLAPKAGIENTTESDLPFAIPDNLPELLPSEEEALSAEEVLAAPEPSRKGLFTGSLLILILLTLAGGQLTWLGRDHLLQFPAGRQLLEQACGYIGCQLPPQRDPTNIAVVSRTISSHPRQENALMVMLTMRNQATFEQPYPLLELSFLDSSGHLIARRSFTPQEYRSSDSGLIQPGIPESISLELQDPGNEVVGFKFDFY